MKKSKKQWDSNLTDYMAKGNFTVDEMADERSRAIVAESYGFHQYKLSLSAIAIRKAVAEEMAGGLSWLRRFILWLNDFLK